MLLAAGGHSFARRLPQRTYVWPSSSSAEPYLDATCADISPTTAKSCRSVISGVLSLAVRYGAITHNPVREAHRIESPPKRAPRALTPEERVSLLSQLIGDPKARKRPAGPRLLHARDGCEDR